MRKILTVLVLTAIIGGAFARKVPSPTPAPQIPDSLRSIYLFTKGIKEAFIARDTAAARAALEQAAAADSTYGATWYELAGLSLYNDTKSALRYAERAVRSDSTDKWYLLQLAQAQVLNERYRDAIGTYDRLREIDPQNPDSYRMLAILYDQVRQPFSAIAVLDSAEVRFGRIDLLSELKQRLLIGTMQYDRAISEIEALIETAPYKVENHLLLGELYARQKKDSLALTQFNEAYRLDSTSIAVLTAFSEFYNDRHDYAAALSYSDKLFSGDEMPLEEKIRYFERITADRSFYGSYYLQINGLATTLALKYPRDPRVVKLYANHLIASGQLEEALAYYKTHLGDQPPQVEFFEAVIDIESYRQRPDSVDLYINRAMQLFPDNPDLYLRKGHSLAYMKRYDEALKFFRNSLELTQSDSLKSAIWNFMGDVYHMQAQQAATKAGKTATEEEMFASRKGPAARYMRKCYDAYDRSLALRPDNPMVLNNYAYFLTLAGRDLERALAMSEQANALEQGNSTYLDTYAWILYRLGRYDEAKRAMQQALSLDRSESPTLQFHYGDILAAMGEYFMAEIYWRKALEGGYENPDAIVERFRQLKEARAASSSTEKKP